MREFNRREIFTRIIPGAVAAVGGFTALGEVPDAIADALGVSYLDFDKFPRSIENGEAAKLGFEAGVRAFERETGLKCQNIPFVIKRTTAKGLGMWVEISATIAGQFGKLEPIYQGSSADLLDEIDFAAYVKKQLLDSVSYIEQSQ